MRIRKHSLNEDYFSSIDTEEKAYWLGFLLADGCTYHSPKSGWVTTVGLKSTDYAHLVKFKTAITATHPIPIRVGKGGFAAARFTVNSEKMFNDLQKLYCHQRKGTVEKLPEIRSDLLKHFFRGYVDGDGTIGQRKDGHWFFGLLGSQNLCNIFSAWIEKELSISRPPTRKIPGIFSILYQSQMKTLSIAKLLYDNSAISLDRKFATYKNLLIDSLNWDYSKLKSKEYSHKIYSDHEKEEILSVYKMPIPIHDICIKFNIDKSTLRKFAEKAGCARPTKSKEWRQENIRRAIINKQSIIADYSGGLSILPISRKFGISAAQINKLLKNEGVLRSSSESRRLCRPMNQKVY